MEFYAINPLWQNIRAHYAVTFGLYVFIFEILDLKNGLNFMVL